VVRSRGAVFLFHYTTKARHKVKSNMLDKTKKKKAKRATKVQDLKPRKDSKGGLIGLLGATKTQLPAVQHQITCRKAGGDPG